MAWQYIRRSRKQFRREGQSFNLILPTPGLNNYLLKRFKSAVIPDLSLLGSRYFRHQLENTGATPPPPVPGKNVNSLRRIVTPVTQDLSVLGPNHIRRTYPTELLTATTRSYGVIII